MNKPLTPKQLKIYRIIIEFIDKKGYSPTLREIAHLANLKSPATIQSHLNNLLDKGYITFEPYKNRTIRIKEK